ncbi:hypothetical protein QSV08_12425 [Maribacter sp. BPC-D8]|uniref:hypothetical protein n=1 Tax=Maribacter sp. BPC-D8 TaxID=3053613 RepID=UPI002B4716AC|nr:hypothetical protein [Maribacter sp. BPC-D8]WRI28030.1 hypothetical protein QSV08_12425 [Maribacter sp. BPC-D8]
MKLKINIVLAGFLSISLGSIAQQLEEPTINENVFFEGNDEIITVEAEHFYKQSKSKIRQWYRKSSTEATKMARDEDEKYHLGASNNTYLEILPDTRVTAEDELIAGENFSNEAGQMGILHYKVNISSPGRYYVWARIFSMGAEDNGLHVGIDENWPEHGQRMQWCEGKNEWTWGSAQRTKLIHCGVAKQIYLDIKKAGIHDIQFSMREDGVKLDKFLLTKDIDYIPNGKGYAEIKKQATALSYIDEIAKTVNGTKIMKAIDFPIKNTNFYLDNAWLAINPEKYKEAAVSTDFPFENGMYDIIFIGVGENDGQSGFQMLVNGNEVGKYSAPLSKNSFEESIKYNKLWKNIEFKKGDKVTVVATVGTDGTEFTRGRWGGIIFAPKLKGKDILENSKAFSIKKNVGSETIVSGSVTIPKDK